MSKRGLLAVILVASFAIRLVLAFRGGQDYWPDESRYQGSQYAVQYATAGNWTEVMRSLFSHPDHSLFGWVGLPAAAAEHVFGRSAFLVSSYFSLFSVLAIYLVWRVARRAGAGEREALLAAVMLSSASSYFYFARHYVPYDSALCVLFLGLELGMARATPFRSLAVGAIAGVGFLIHNGYWLLGGCVLGLHVVSSPICGREVLRRSGWGALGLLGVTFGFLGCARLLGYDLLARHQENAGTISQGDFGIGYRLIPEYLWHAEGLLAVVWFAGLALGVFYALRTDAPARLRTWLLAILLITGGLIALSDVIPVFVVYGRLIRSLVPFLCLVSAYVIDRWADAQVPAIPRSRWMLAAAGLAVIAAYNFAIPLTQRFPIEFQATAREEAIRRQAGDGSIYRTIATAHPSGGQLSRRLPAHQVILRARHPLQFEPYQYEGFSEAQRTDFLNHDVSMRLIRLPVRLPAAHGVSSPHVGPLAFRVRFPSDVIGTTEPLITTGVAGAGDMVYVSYEDASTIRIGVDSWSRGGMLSDPIPIDYQVEHDLLVSLESFLQSSELEPTTASLIASGLRNRLVVAIDGKFVLAFLSQQHPTGRADVSLGANRIGMTSAQAEFSGDFREVRYATIDEVRVLRPSVADRMMGRGPGWAGYSGPVSMRIRLPDPLPPPGVAEPLLVGGETGAGDFISVIYRGANGIQIGFDHWGYTSFVSETVPAKAGQEMELNVSVGFLLPPIETPLPAGQPPLDPFRNRVMVEVDGRRILDRESASHPSRANQVTVGVNRIGGSTATERFSGDIREIRPWEGYSVP